jgi:hypothetical protein
MLPRGDSFRVQAAKARRGSKGGKLAANRMTKAQRVARAKKAGRSFREGAEREGEEEAFNGGK